MTDRRATGRPVHRPDRRQVLSLGLGAFVVASLPLALARRGERQVVRRRVPVMGTLAELAVVTDDRRRAHAALDRAVAELGFVDRTMSWFTADSDVGRANADAARDAVRLRPETADVVAEALAWASATDGRFDPCLGRATALWDVGHRTTPPDAPAYGALAGRSLWRRLDLGMVGGDACLRYGDADVSLDLGGIAKGYGVDRAAAAIRRAGFADALVNVGGDLVALGRSPDGDPWQVGIRSPEDPEAFLATVAVSDEAVATSGDYEQAFVYANRRFHHLLDPRTAAPRATTRRSVTVAAPTCMAADAAATAVFGLADADAAALLAAVGRDARIVGVA